MTPDLRDILDRLGCFLQVGIGIGTFVALGSWTPLPGWAAAIAAVAGSYFGVWVLVFVVSAALDAVE